MILNKEGFTYTLLILNCFISIHPVNKNRT